MKAQPPGWIEDASYASALLTYIETGRPGAGDEVIGELLDCSPRIIMRIRKCRMQVNYPMQILMESQVKPAIVKELKKHYLSKQRPTYWALQEKRYARR